MKVCDSPNSPSFKDVRAYSDSSPIVRFFPCNFQNTLALPFLIPKYALSSLNQYTKVELPVNGPNDILEKGGWKPKTVRASSWDRGLCVPTPSVEYK